MRSDEDTEEVMDTFLIQTQIKQWVVTRLGQKAMQPTERGRRVHEESTELFQSVGGTREEAHRIVDHVFDKPAGNPLQELGGCALTLLACADSLDFDLGVAAQDELDRIVSLPVEKFKKRQAENVMNGIGE
jgi:hypothetical protein